MSLGGVASYGGVDGSPTGEGFTRPPRALREGLMPPQRAPPDSLRLSLHKETYVKRNKTKAKSVKQVVPLPKKKKDEWTEPMSSEEINRRIAN